MYQLPCKYLIYITFLRFRSKLKKRRKFIFIGHARRGTFRALKRLYSKNMLYMLKSQVRELLLNKLWQNIKKEREYQAISNAFYWATRHRSVDLIKFELLVCYNDALMTCSRKIYCLFLIAKGYIYMDFWMQTIL